MSLWPFADQSDTSQRRGWFPAAQIIDKPFAMKDEGLALANPGVRGQSPDEIREPESGMYGRRLPVPLWVQDCPCIADAQILHFRVDKPCLSTRRAAGMVPRRSSQTIPAAY